MILGDEVGRGERASICAVDRKEFVPTVPLWPPSVEHISLVFWKYKRRKSKPIDKQVPCNGRFLMCRSIIGVRYSMIAVTNGNIFLVYGFELCCGSKLSFMTHESSHNSSYSPNSSQDIPNPNKSYAQQYNRPLGTTPLIRASSSLRITTLTSIQEPSTRYPSSK